VRPKGEVMQEISLAFGIVWMRIAGSREVPSLQLEHALTNGSDFLNEIDHHRVHAL
jgi:hypothetical protein